MSQVSAPWWLPQMTPEQWAMYQGMLNGTYQPPGGSPGPYGVPGGQVGPPEPPTPLADGQPTGNVPDETDSGTGADEEEQPAPDGSTNAGGATSGGPQGGIPGYPGGPPQPPVPIGGGLPPAVNGGAPGTGGNGQPSTNAGGATYGGPQGGIPGQPGAGSYNPDGIPGAPTAGIPPAGGIPGAPIGPGAGAAGGIPGGPPGTGGTVPGTPTPAKPPIQGNPPGQPPTDPNNPGGGLSAAELEALRNQWIQQQGQQAMQGGPQMNGYGSGVPGGSAGYIPTGSATNPYMPGLFAPSPGSNAAAGKLVGNAANSFQQAQNQANQANTDLANKITNGYDALSQNSANTLGGLSGLFGQQQNQFGNNASNVQSGFNNLGATQNQAYNNLVGNLAQGQSGINQGYNNVENQIMNNLSLLGSTQTQDINQAYQQQRANADQGLVDRGLNNTTIQNSTNAGLDFNRQRALLANAEGTQGMVNNALMQTAYPALQAQQQGVNNVTNLAQQGVGANTALGTQALGNQYQGGQDMANLQGQALQFGQNANNTQNQLGLQQLGFLNSINQTGPNYNMLAQLMQQVGAAGTGYGVNGYAGIPASAGNVAPSSVLGQLQGPGTAPYGGIPQPPKPLNTTSAV